MIRDIGGKSDNSYRKSARVPCRQGGVDLPHRASTPRLPGERLLEYTLQRAFHVFDMEAATLRVGACQERKKKDKSLSLSQISMKMCCKLILLRNIVYALYAVHV